MGTQSGWLIKENPKGKALWIPWLCVDSSPTHYTEGLLLIGGGASSVSWSTVDMSTVENRINSPAIVTNLANKWGAVQLFMLFISP